MDRLTLFEMVWISLKTPWRIINHFSSRFTQIVKSIFFFNLFKWVTNLRTRRNLVNFPKKETPVIEPFGNATNSHSFIPRERKGERVDAEWRIDQSRGQGEWNLSKRRKGPKGRRYDPGPTGRTGPVMQRRNGDNDTRYETVARAMEGTKEEQMSTMSYGAA